jgi:GNAT superfamily N-acetyltransferase
MTFPNPHKGPFEGENKDWARHVAANFVAGVTGPMLDAPGCDPAHAAIAHFQGFICCAYEDAQRRGNGKQIMDDILDQVRPWILGLANGEATMVEKDRAGPILTALPGGKG